MLALGTKHLLNTPNDYGKTLFEHDFEASLDSKLPLREVGRLRLVLGKGSKTLSPNLL